MLFEIFPILRAGGKKNKIEIFLRHSKSLKEVYENAAIEKIFMLKIINFHDKNFSCLKSSNFFQVRIL